MNRLGLTGLLTAIFVYSSAPPVHAYIDPGSTSMLLQLIVGGLAAGIVATRRLWEGTVQRALRAFRREPKSGR